MALSFSQHFQSSNRKVRRTRFDAKRWERVKILTIKSLLLASQPASVCATPISKHIHFGWGSNYEQYFSIRFAWKQLLLHTLILYHISGIQKFWFFMKIFFSRFLELVLKIKLSKKAPNSGHRGSCGAFWTQWHFSKLIKKWWKTYFYENSEFLYIRNCMKKKYTQS